MWQHLHLPAARWLVRSRPAKRNSTQEDPIGLAGGLNLYGYAGGDPINNSDPFELSVCPPACGEVIQQLSSVARDLKVMMEVGAAVTLAPVVIVASAEIGATALAVPVLERAVVGVIVKAAENKLVGFGLGVLQGLEKSTIVGGAKPRGVNLQPSFGAADTLGRMSARFSARQGKLSCLWSGSTDAARVDLAR